MFIVWGLQGLGRRFHGLRGLGLGCRVEVSRLRALGFKAYL